MCQGDFAVFNVYFTHVGAVISAVASVSAFW
jgi:hypothetical protein